MIPSVFLKVVPYITAADKIGNIAEKWWKKRKSESKQSDASDYEDRLSALEDNDRLLANAIKSMQTRMIALFGVSIVTAAIAIAAVVFTLIR